MKNIIAKLISGITSPFIVICGFGFWIIAAVSSSFSSFLLWIALFAILVIGLPLGYILVGIKRGTISDVHVAIREQRSMPFISATIGALLLLTAYLLLHAPIQLTALAACLAVSGTIFGIITLFWKISIHAAAFTGSVIIVSMLLNTYFLWLLLLVPLVSWARYIRKRHSIAQAILATIAVSICVFITLELILQ